MGVPAIIAPRRSTLSKVIRCSSLNETSEHEGYANMIEIDDHFVIKFRVGACQGSHWLRNDAKRSAKKGKKAQEISDRLGQLLQVLLLADVKLGLRRASS